MAIFCFLLLLLFLANLNFSVEGKRAAEIIETNEIPGRIYREGQTALMKVLYFKPDNFGTEWTLTKTTVGYKDFLYALVPDTTRLDPTSVAATYNSTVGSYTETFETETSITNSGTYTFRIIDPSKGQTVKMTNFSLKIAAAPDVQIHKFDNNLQLGQIYSFECRANGYPLPEITWEFSTCKNDFCEDTWARIRSANEPDQLDATYYRSQQIGFKAETYCQLRCVASNTEGKQTSQAIIIIPADLDQTEQIVAHRGDQFNFICPVQKSAFEEYAVWSKKLSNGNEILLAYQHGPVIRFFKLDRRHKLSYDYKSSNFSDKYILTFTNISKGDVGYYICKVTDKDKRFHSLMFNLTVKDDFPPSIYPIGNNMPIELVSGAQLSLQCKANGEPPPSVIWYKDGQMLDAKQNNNDIIVTPESLEFAHIHESDKGIYICNATNRVGSAQKSFDLRYKSVFTQNQIVFIVALCVGSVLLISLFCMVGIACANCRGRQKLIELEMLLNSNEMKQFDVTLPIFDNIYKDPKVKPGYKYRLKVDSLIIDQRNIKVLGKGNFGVVIEAKLRMADGSAKKVVLKRTKSNIEVDQYLMLYKEICLMTYIEKHSNIVNMIGFVSNISRGQLYLVMELCADGSLENWLKSVRNDFRLKFTSELRTHYQNTSGGNRYCQEDFPDWPVIKATLEGHIFHSDLISYAYQVALGMEYLGSLDFVHRDLAARNVLLSHNFKVAKIADFGLSLKLANQNYKMFDRQENLQVPIRWTAPESFLFKEFSSGSDVWSFGVLTGEIFSLGVIPFSHVSDSQFVSKLLRKEITPNRPVLASDNIYQLMLSCCHYERRSRISFTEAKAQLSREFRRCSPDQMTILSALLDGIQQEFDYDSSTESDITVEGNSIFYTRQPPTVFNDTTDVLPTAINSQGS